jgi:GNAT superfamily N-acetyltransferase
MRESNEGARNLIVEVVDNRSLAPAIIERIRQEWPSASGASEMVERRICGDYQRQAFPATLAAVESGTLRGFVVLIHHDNSAAQGRPHWIDAVFVEPAFRRKGLALELIAAAEQRAKALGATSLFALTDVPALYAKAGWAVEETLFGEISGFVMKRDLET